MFYTFKMKESAYISAPPVPLVPEKQHRTQKTRKITKPLNEDDVTTTSNEQPTEEEHTKYQVIDAIPSEMKDKLEEFFAKTRTEPNRYYPEDKSSSQAIKRYLGKDSTNYSIRIAAIDDKHDIKALIDAIPLDINDNQLHCYAAYVYGDPTSDADTNEVMIEHLLTNAMHNPDQSIKWIVFNDLSKYDNKKWINALEKFGFVQPYRFVDPSFKDVVVEVHVLRSSVSGGYPITAETDVRNKEFNPENNAQLEDQNQD